MWIMVAREYHLNQNYGKQLKLCRFFANAHKKIHWPVCKIPQTGCRRRCLTSNLRSNKNSAPTIAHNQLSIAIVEYED